MQRGRPQRDDKPGRHEADFLVQPPAIMSDITRCRRLVKTPLAALLELEALDGIGEEALCAVHARLFQAGIQQLPGWPDKHLPRHILLIARLLANKHEWCMARPL